MGVETLFVGIEGKKIVDSKKTMAQIEKVRALECALESKDGKRITWDDIDNPKEPRTLFQLILGDRKRRVGKRSKMGDRSSYCVVTAMDGKVVRLEFYEVHDLPSLVFDIRVERAAK
jgi:hypothetical protein